MVTKFPQQQISFVQILLSISENFKDQEHLDKRLEGLL